ncbi:COP9 signalosome complex subunit 6-like [Sycon ciliatum]|uniref:COP9 signalosome complex subunit 6-like n=1 Tax=Sycon ciliatum TaxID=27933 RepID=UPI0020AE29EA|eukprot:scpid85476/ scgid10393/ COP9 signalosome complex subunit 6
MERSSTKQHAVAAPSGSIKVAVHPLVVMNISDQYTREKVRHTNGLAIVGALLGRQSGREIEVCNSFDLKYHVIDNAVVIDMPFLKQRDTQYKQVFKNLELLGWYTAGSQPAGEREEKLLHQLTSFNENPIWLKFNPQSDGLKQPITLYETVFDVTSSGPVVQFVEVNTSLAAEEAERICVDHVARLRHQNASEESQVAGPLSSQASAIRMLQTRIVLLQEYIKAVQDGSLPGNMDVQRSISSLCNRLPLMNSEQLIESSNEKSNDVTLMTYLSTLTKSCAILNEVITKTMHAEDRAGRKPRQVGLLKTLGT